MKLIPNWKQVALKSFTAWAIGIAQIGIAVILFWPNIPEDFKPFIDVRAVVWLVGIVLALGFVGRLIQQFDLEIEAQTKEGGQ